MGQAPRGSDRPGAGEPCRLRRSNRIARRERTMDDDTQASKRLYRVDKFLVPDEAREEYLQNLRATHELLRKQPGFVQDFVLEPASGQSGFNFVTIAEWASQGAIDAARLAVPVLPRDIDHAPPVLFARPGVK